ncbi:sensor histidine kinase, partial [Angustibacter speluncae]
MLRSFGIRSKILAVLALPVLVLALAASVIATTAVRDATKARQIEALTDQAGGLVDLVRGLGTERALTVASLAGNEEAGAQLVAVRAAIDEAMAKVDQNNTELDLSSLDEASRAGYAAAAAANDTLPGLRRQVDGDILTPETALLRYTEVINADIAVPAAIADGVDDRQLAAQLRAYSANLELMDAISIERDISTPAIAAGGYDEATHEAAVDAARRTDLIRERTTSLSLAAQVRTPATGYTMQLARQRTIDDADRVLENVTVDYWVGAFDEDIDALGTGFTALIDGAKERAQSLADGADRRSIEVIVLALLAVLVPVALALWLARRITRPLRRLTEAAGQIRRDLPKMVEQMATPGEGPDISIPEIPVQSNDEVGRLARAFNEVNSTTVATAQEQAALRGSIAAMFVNVARRDQVLLSRQLAFLDQLERTEENPDTLDNLFKLDHLATRMRRNAESLLVLAGIDTGRRLRRPMPLADVVRTASSEIEHYERVDLAQHVDPPMVGHAALIAAHLLAELLENSTAFSDPGSRVLVSTEAGPLGVRVTITDEGLGMSPEELAEFNDRIQNPPVSEVVGAQRLGFYVVGRLANRLEAVVTLAPGRDERGTVVTVDLPAALFTPGSIEGPDAATGSAAAAKD